ncbi:hypothetical protein RD110_07060 [Rhodoferax koreense]|uniref:NAD-dependent epimerase/dehydratase domain-containing protein n=1 Tax=Rhodoferax koreensis TaxID=1842727 RepID=A0A1P8JTB7_9BURK|nr:SDR family oxidoreductase [Rhodoferax koreense]APW36988.1 hypothetical protein RD110_07060 [Rhodoferax koreense]
MMWHQSMHKRRNLGACLVSGANGFLGSALLRHLRMLGTQKLIGTVRDISTLATVASGTGVQIFEVGDIDGTTDWSTALSGVQSVVHAAARVHVMYEMPSADTISLFRRTNVEATLHLARQAAVAGVERFVYVSSVKVNGERTAPHRPFFEDSAPRPEDAYAISKYEAEKGLAKIEAQTGMQLVVVRPPLVYGPGVRANFASLMKAVARGAPLPLAAVQNRRSLVALDNLVDFIATCMVHPAAAGQTFLVSDGEDVATADLVRRLAQAMHRPARLFAVPPGILTAAASFLGRRAQAQRLCESLQVDISKARSLLDWTPPIGLDEGLRRAVEGVTR